MPRTNQKLVACLGGIGLAALASANPVSSVSINGSITFTDAIEHASAGPFGRSGLHTRAAWTPSGLTLPSAAPEVASYSRFLVDDAPPAPNDMAPRIGDAWGLAMATAVELREVGTVTATASHSMHLTFSDMTHASSAYTLRGIIDLSVTGSARVQDAQTETATAMIRAEAWAKGPDRVARLISFGDIRLEGGGIGAVNRSLYITFELAVPGSTAAGQTSEMWIDVSMNSRLTMVPAPGAVALLIAGLAAPVVRRRR